MNPRHRPQAGFSLIEVLITLFVVAVGLLSIAGLQAFSKKSNFDAVQRSTAAALAQDIIERMRANSALAANYVTDPYVGISEANPQAAPAVDCGAAVCTPAQQVSFDLYQWSQALFGAAEVAGDGTNAGGLSVATACITAATAPACGLYNVTIAWRGVTSLDGDDPRSGTQFNCGTGAGASSAYTSADGKPLRRLVTVQTFIDPQSQCSPASTR